MKQAKKIGNDLAQTFIQLEQLTLGQSRAFVDPLAWPSTISVAKGSSLFNDKSMEIQDLTLSVKQNISHMNREIGELQQVEESASASSWLTSSMLILVHASDSWSEVEKLPDTFQFGRLCSTSTIPWALSMRREGRMLFSSQN